jgi:hypothetical protein
MRVDVMSGVARIKIITAGEMAERHEVKRADFRQEMQPQFSGGICIMNTNHFHLFVCPVTRHSKTISHIGKHIAAIALPSGASS